MALVQTLLALGALIALHELGHMLTARAFGMRVDRYSIGFGPVILAYTHGETEYALSLLPFGGYVKIAGMNPADGTDVADPRSYANAPAWKRFIVIFAGPMANYLITFLILANLNVFGMPRPVPTPTLGEVQPGSAAAVAGLKPEDRVVSVDGKPVSTFEGLHEAIVATGGKTIAIVIDRGGHTQSIQVTPRADRAGGFLIGASPKTLLEKLPFFTAVGHAARDTALWNAAIVVGLAGAIAGKVNLQLGGTVAAVSETTQAAKLGLAPFFLTLAGISVFLALINLLPVPALDGGRLFFLLIEMIRRRPVNPRFETAVHAVGFLALLGVMVYLTIGDVQKYLGPTASGASDAGEMVDGGP